jgi:hypothetical protein
MSEFYAIINNASNAPRANAQLDVSVDTAATGGAAVNVSFFVYRATDGVQVALFEIPTNANGFASTAPSQNLFQASGGETALIKAVTPSGAPSMAVLRQRVQGQAKIVLGVPPLRKLDATLLGGGVQFSVAIGDIMSGTALLIANVSSVAAMVDVFQGTRGVQGQGKYKNPDLQPNAIWRVDLQATDANSNLVIRSTEPMVIQLAVDDGKVDGATLVPT